jgi:preprotein translocase subunit YajC
VHTFKPQFCPFFTDCFFCLFVLFCFVFLIFRKQMRSKETETYLKSIDAWLSVCR